MFKFHYSFVIYDYSKFVYNLILCPTCSWYLYNLYSEDSDIWALVYSQTTEQTWWLRLWRPFMNVNWNHCYLVTVASLYNILQSFAPITKWRSHILTKTFSFKVGSFLLHSKNNWARQFIKIKFLSFLL